MEIEVHNFAVGDKTSPTAVSERSTMAKKRFYDGDYSGPLNVARRQEAKDFSMISEDKSACANLPQREVYREWPKGGSYATSDYNDTISGINEQERADSAGAKRRKGGYKY